MTSQLQPLDVSASKPFKHLVRNDYDAWLDKDNLILTPSGKIKRALASVIVEWISKAWKEVAVTIIPKSFLKCCLSNTEDGTQDGILWDGSEENGEGASSSESEYATEGSLEELSD
jgi:hypothetical protein